MQIVLIAYISIYIYSIYVQDSTAFNWCKRMQICVVFSPLVFPGACALEAVLFAMLCLMWMSSWLVLKSGGWALQQRLRQQTGVRLSAIYIAKTSHTFWQLVLYSKRKKKYPWCFISVTYVLLQTNVALQCTVLTSHAKEKRSFNFRTVSGNTQIN